MYNFLESMKNYIKDGINDADIPKTSNIEVYDADTKGHTPQKTEIQFKIMDNSEVERYNTFNGANIFSIPLQITIFAFQTKIAGKMTSARQSSIILADKVNKLLNALDVVNYNSNVKRVRIMTTTPAMPFEGGDKAYTTAIRCEFWVAKE